MADLVSPFVSLIPCLWDCCGKQAAYITHLAETLNSLRTRMGELEAIRDDVNLKVRLAKHQGMLQSNQVANWLSRVRDTEYKVMEVFKEHERITDNCSACLRKCQWQSAYKLGRKAKETLNTITDLIKSRGEIQEVAYQQPLPISIKQTVGLRDMPMENTVGNESVLMNVLEWLEDDKVGIIGLFGMGGVGKTTLLKKINNALPKSGYDVFDVAFWVVASKSATIEGIQQEIMGKLNIPYETWRNKSMVEKSAKINEVLRDKKYILMLDNVWERLDLLRVGFPLPDHVNKSKIIFTTRSEDICFSMEVHQKIEVTCLPPDEAWLLFQEKLGGATIFSHPHVPEMAREVAKKCGGLPLTLITIGQAWNVRESPSGWNYVKSLLENQYLSKPGKKKSLSKFPDLGYDLRRALEFGYDRLCHPTTKECFLYCSLFPEDFEIPRKKLVDLWIGEGYLKEHDIKEARDHGYSVIQKLRRVCLLESGSKSSASVKMHDVIRDMALWVANVGKHNKRFLTLGEAELMGIENNILDWNEDVVEKMMLWGDQEMFKKSLLTRVCPMLSTLVVRKNLSRNSLSGLFKFIPNVRVLDLSENMSLSSLPEGISELKNLEYLDLSSTAIVRLPEEFKRLVNLRYLLMNSLYYLEECPTEIIIGLTELLVFRMDGFPPCSEFFLRGLDALKKIQETSIYVNSADTLDFFLKSEKLQRCTRFMKLKYINLNLFKLCLTNMKYLESFEIYDSELRSLQFSNPTAMVFSDLCSVVIGGCSFLEELDFLAYAPSLAELRVWRCRSLRRIFGIEDRYLEICGGTKRVSLNLKSIVLDELPCLEIICNKPLPFPTLESIIISNCPKLQQNPFNDIPTNNNYTIIISGVKGWWDSLRWRDASLQQHFSQYFKELSE